MLAYWEIFYFFFITATFMHRNVKQCCGHEKFTHARLYKYFLLQNNNYKIYFQRSIIFIYRSSIVVPPPPPSCKKEGSYCFAAVCLSVGRSANSLRAFSLQSLHILWIYHNIYFGSNRAIFDRGMPLGRRKCSIIRCFRTFSL